MDYKVKEREIKARVGNGVWSKVAEATASVHKFSYRAVAGDARLSMIGDVGTYVTSEVINKERK